MTEEQQEEQTEDQKADQVEDQAEDQVEDQEEQEEQEEEDQFPLTDIGLEIIQEASRDLKNEAIEQFKFDIVVLMVRNGIVEKKRGILRHGDLIDRYYINAVDRLEAGNVGVFYDPDNIVSISDDSNSAGEAETAVEDEAEELEETGESDFAMDAVEDPNAEPDQDSSQAEEHVSSLDTESELQGENLSVQTTSEQPNDDQPEQPEQVIEQLIMLDMNDFQQAVEAAEVKHEGGTLTKEQLESITTLRGQLNQIVSSTETPSEPVLEIDALPVEEQYLLCIARDGCLDRYNGEWPNTVVADKTIRDRIHQWADGCDLKKSYDARDIIRKLEQGWGFTRGKTAKGGARGHRLPNLKSLRDRLEQKYSLT